jgi:hypothetical protein
MLLKSNRHALKLKSINLKLKKSLIRGSVKNNYRYKEYRVYIPHMWDVLITGNTKRGTTVFRMTSDVYYANLAFKNSHSFITFDSCANVISFKSLYTNCYYLPFFRAFEFALMSFIKPTFIKLKFKGKGYYIYKNGRNTIAPQFGYSHRLYIYSYFCAVKFLGKTKVLLFGFSRNDLLTSSLLLKEKRSINIFTGRGVRFSKQVIYKKQGKVSSYR